MYLEPIKQRLIDLNLVTSADLSGCTYQEIIKLEQQLEVKLPTAYQEFLRMMGKGAGQFLRGLDCFYPHLKELQVAAIELLEENHFSVALPNEAFVFFMHQGYQFSFFRLSEGEDPPTYSYCEGDSLILDKGRTALLIDLRLELQRLSDVKAVLPLSNYFPREQHQSFIKTHERYSEFLATEVELHQKYLITVTTP